MLEINDLRVAVDGKEILTGVDLRVAPGETTRSWGRTARARARSRTCSRAATATR